MARDATTPALGGAGEVQSTHVLADAPESKRRDVRHQAKRAAIEFGMVHGIEIRCDLCGEWRVPSWHGRRSVDGPGNCTGETV